MDFVTGFPKSRKGNDAIFVVIDRLSKVAHFLPVKETISASQLAKLYTARIVSLHGVPLEISSDRGSITTSKFWASFQKAMGTNLLFSTAYHPQTSGQVERVNQILEDMLRACVISFGMKWEECLPSPSSPTTTAIKPVWAWHLLKLNMVADAEHLSTGLEPVKGNSLVLI